MTFFVSIATHDFAFQVADMRLTDADTEELVDDFACKTTIVRCTDATLVMSYTGVASILGIRTDRWLALQLHSLRSWERSFATVASHVRDGVCLLAAHKASMVWPSSSTFT